MYKLIDLEWNKSSCNRALTIESAQDAAYALLWVLYELILFLAEIYLRFGQFLFIIFKLFKRFLQIVSSFINVHLLLVVFGVMTSCLWGSNLTNSIHELPDTTTHQRLCPLDEH